MRENADEREKAPATGKLPRPRWTRPELTDQFHVKTAVSERTHGGFILITGLDGTRYALCPQSIVSSMMRSPTMLRRRRRHRYRLLCLRILLPRTRGRQTRLDEGLPVACRIRDGSCSAPRPQHALSRL